MKTSNIFLFSVLEK